MHWNWSWWIWPVAKVTREFGRDRIFYFFYFILNASWVFVLLSVFIVFFVGYLLIYWLFQQKALQTNRVSFQHTGGNWFACFIPMLVKVIPSSFLLFLEAFFVCFKALFWGGGGVYVYIFFALEYWTPLTESLFWIYILTLCLLQLAWVPEWTHQHRLMLVKKTSFHVHKTILIPFCRSFI